jgi:hypothetical protein
MNLKSKVKAASKIFEMNGGIRLHRQLVLSDSQMGYHFSNIM